MRELYQSEITIVSGGRNRLIQLVVEALSHSIQIGTAVSQAITAGLADIAKYQDSEAERIRRMRELEEIIRRNQIPEPSYPQEGPFPPQMQFSDDEVKDACDEIKGLFGDAAGPDAAINQLCTNYLAQHNLAHEN
jgi:hypothetical protein